MSGISTFTPLFRAFTPLFRAFTPLFRPVRTPFRRHADVLDFYQKWTHFESWRDFSLTAEQDVSDPQVRTHACMYTSLTAEHDVSDPQVRTHACMHISIPAPSGREAASFMHACISPSQLPRDEKRRRQRENAAEIAKLKRSEGSRVQAFVQLAYHHDLRVAAAKKQVGIALPRSHAPNDSQLPIPCTQCLVTQFPVVQHPVPNALGPNSFKPNGATPLTQAASLKAQAKEAKALQRTYFLTYLLHRPRRSKLRPRRQRRSTGPRRTHRSLWKKQVKVGVWGGGEGER